MKSLVKSMQHYEKSIFICCKHKSLNLELLYHYLNFYPKRYFLSKFFQLFHSIEAMDALVRFLMLAIDALRDELLPPGLDDRRPE